MPHIKLEYTQKIEPSLIRPVLKQLRNILVENTGVKEYNCKCKAIRILVYAADSYDNSRHFYHLQISLLKGRSEEIRQKIGQQSLEFLKEHFANNSKRHQKQISVEIREMKPQDYFTTNIL